MRVGERERERERERESFFFFFFFFFSPPLSLLLSLLLLSLSSHLKPNRHSYVAAMQTPRDGKNDIPNRLKRHFAVFCVPQPAPAALGAIFGPLVRVSAFLFLSSFFFFFLLLDLFSSFVVDSVR